MIKMINITELINTTKLLLYKENPSLLEKVDFEDDIVFLEPLLFSYFNSKKDKLFATELLIEIMQGYFIEKEPLRIDHSYNNEGIAYIPNVGYFNNEKEKVDDVFIIKNSSIELLIHPTIHLKHIFKDFNENNIDEAKIEISEPLCNKYKNALFNAFQYIKTSNEEHFDLIEQCCKKVVLFKSDPKNTNSFATINAHGIAFFNVYQDDYDEVFFVDDIAHQTGHIILTSLLFVRKNYFINDENSGIAAITNNRSEYRSFYILFHALYTYYTTVLCLNSCLMSKHFNKIQVHEANARIGFYLLKYKSDLLNFEKVINHFENLENVLTIKGIEVYKSIEDKYFEINKKYSEIVETFDYRNQPYNFTFKEFLKQNPMTND